ncbi:unnamed protein product [Chondrus crispus]|uniref:Uncharacterized protein n=1 Tax=Chondrus crispus TaxID=2769 RepID=R7QMV3_CHOCR|nr:unnamed protein product [Chondrus crispus]CDF39088.1 unnamed protein product [Chondrus crispus]|eukprot:XP_005718999.1 unnamed protein product [Chondrus crispus]
MFTSNDPADDDDDDLSAELSSYNAAQLWRGDSATTNSGDDYGLFIPSFNHRQQRAVPLGPREVFNFVYKVVQKGRNAAEPALLHKEAAAKENRSQPEETAFKLKHGTCLETSVAVAWNCVPKLSAIVAAPADADADADEAFHRELSSGGVLATGRRGNVAVRWTCVHWRPPALIEDVLVAFSGPPVCNVGDRLSVSVTILNQTADDLVSAAVCVQQEEDAQMDLLALRTVLVVGHIASGQETTVQIPCIAFRAGSLSLGPVQIMDRGNPEENRTVWTSQAAYAVFVVDPKALIPGDPQPPRPFVVQENETNMIAG